ncbi:MAG TPA: Holliday junction branch migration protein RuvA [Gemmataceae bacterium]|jgi:Holliday junction DNA helicase RuvA
MITAITGALNRVLDEEARLQAGPFEYAVLVPEFVRRQLQTRLGQEVTLHTSHFLEGNQMSSRYTPRLIGFLTEAELEFFDLFCTVDKVGVRKALKALARPVRDIADAVQRQDAKWLTSLPGIGGATADAMLATLRKKVAKFVQLPDGDGAIPHSAGGATAGQVIEDAYAALIGLGLNPIDARGRLDAAVGGGQTYPSVESLLAAIFSKR